MGPRSNTRDSGQRQLKSEEGLPCSPLGTVHNYQSPHTHKRSQTAGKANTQGGGEEQRLKFRSNCLQPPLPMGFPVMGSNKFFFTV